MPETLRVEVSNFASTGGDDVPLGSQRRPPAIDFRVRWSNNVCPTWHISAVGSGMPASPMSDPGQAQLDLIRRYARTLRVMHADAMAVRGPHIGAQAARRSRTDRFTRKDASATPGVRVPQNLSPRGEGQPGRPSAAGR
jgi:hypothetical protein